MKMGGKFKVNSEGNIYVEGASVEGENGAEPVMMPSTPLLFEVPSEAINNTMMAIKEEAGTTPTGSFKTHFEMRPDGSIVCCTEPEHNIITLKADHIIDMSLLRDEDPSAVDMYLKKELARKLADKMIEEDVIKIQYSDDPATLDRTYRATVKFIQE